MINDLLYPNLGAAIQLLANSPYHQEFELKRYLQVEIAPAFRRQQAKFFYDGKSPIGLVTWARLSSEVLTNLAVRHRSLEENEWQSGEVAFVNDLIVKDQHLNRVIDDVRNGLFWADSLVYAFRRSRDGSVKRLCKFKNFPEGSRN
jgi:hemolysin-activating ACP:hemolysin acyltransferase